MAQTINTKVMSLNVEKYLHSAQEKAEISTQRLGSGLRVNSARDDAAGMAIAERMNTQLRGMSIGVRNANDGISMSQTAEGGLKQVNDVLQRMRELAVQSANGTNSSADRENLNLAFTSLNSEIARIASTTKFNGETVLANNGSSVNFQLGPNAGMDDTLSVELVGIDSLSAGIATYEDSLAAIDDIDSMIANVTGSRADFGAMQSRFESAIDNLQLGAENQSAARARIMDADYAVETARLTSAQMQQQAGTAMATQANTSPQSVMQLLG